MGGVGFDEQSPPELVKAEGKERRKEEESPGQGVEKGVERALLKQVKGKKDHTLRGRAQASFDSNDRGTLIQ